jgi:hypothetical protein
MNSRWGLLAGSLLWVAFVFGLQVALSAAIGRDSGFGEEFHCRLPNGYRLSGKAPFLFGRLTSSKGGPEFDCVVRLCERDDLILLDRVVGCEGANTSNEFVLLHTLYFDVKRFSTQEEMRKAASAVGMAPELRLVSDVYRDRRGWVVDATLILLALLPPLWVLARKLTGRRTG